MTIQSGTYWTQEDANVDEHHPSSKKQINQSTKSKIKIVYLKILFKNFSKN